MKYGWSMGEFMSEIWKNYGWSMDIRWVGYGWKMVGIWVKCHGYKLGLEISNLNGKIWMEYGLKRISAGEIKVKSRVNMNRI